MRYDYSVKGFGLTIGSDISILFVNHKYYDSLGVIKSGLQADVMHGTFTSHNASNSTTQPSFAGTFGFVNATNSHISRGWFTISSIPAIFDMTQTSFLLVLGCYRDPDWPWYRQPFPWWTMFFLVPLYSTCSSLSILQSFRSSRLPIMIIFSCCSYSANKASTYWATSTRDGLVELRLPRWLLEFSSLYRCVVSSYHRFKGSSGALSLGTHFGV